MLKWKLLKRFLTIFVRKSFLIIMVLHGFLTFHAKQDPSHTLPLLLIRNYFHHRMIPHEFLSLYEKRDPSSIIVRTTWIYNFTRKARFTPYPHLLSGRNYFYFVVWYHMDLQVHLHFLLLLQGRSYHSIIVQYHMGLQLYTRSEIHFPLPPCCRRNYFYHHTVPRGFAIGFYYFIYFKLL